jgi:hypothetical protein
VTAVARYEDDATMRALAGAALLARCPWYGDLKMSDSEGVITRFLQDWRAAQARHDTGGRSIVSWVSVWAAENRAAYAREYPYLVGAE